MHIHFNDLLLEPLKKISFKTFAAKRRKWWNGDARYVTPGINSAAILKEFVLSPSPGMIARYGSTELTCILANILSASKESYFKKALMYLKGEIPAFWFGYKNTTEIGVNSGFFPNDFKSVKRFSEKMLEDTKMMDIFLTWIDAEKYTFPYFSPDCKKVHLWDVQPFFCAQPWTMFLEHKKVLVIHPFSKSISLQYGKRNLIFPEKQILPEMELITLQAVQTVGNSKTEFATWFHALDYMEKEIEKKDFNIALIGAGAYGFPLAASIKRMGKKAIHIGGSLQLYFGIRGKRWETDPNFQNLFNEHWVRPLPEEHPKDYMKVERGVYW